MNFQPIQSIADIQAMIYHSYLKALPHTKGLTDRERKSPELTKRLLQLLGNPDRSQRIVLVTGSKGKGSTSLFIAALLEAHGYRVGYFSSPHLVDIHERIRVNRRAISDVDLIRLAGRVQPAVQAIEAGIPEDRFQGPVGIFLAIAMLYFQEQQTDYQVIEIGRGGTYDDTNVLENQWAVITPIFEEHLDFLGPSIDDIIEHKLGIIKDSTRAVFLQHQDPKIRPKIEKKLLNHPMATIYNAAFEVEHVKLSQSGTRFDVRTDLSYYDHIEVPLLGRFHAENIGLAIQTCEGMLGEPLDGDRVRTGLATIQCPGRCEIIAQSPTVIVDAAIHRTSALFLKESVEAALRHDAAETTPHIVSIIGVSNDKNYEGVVDVLLSFSQQIVITRPDVTYKEFSLDEALSYAVSVAAGTSSTVTTSPSLTEAIEQLRQTPEVDMILIVGNHSLIGNAKRIWGQSLRDLV